MNNLKNYSHSWEVLCYIIWVVSDILSKTS